MHVNTQEDSINGFLKKCMPSSLQFFVFNYVSDTMISAAFYLDGLKDAIKGVTEEVFLQSLELGENELQELIKAASQCSRLVFYGSNVHCSSALDFNIESEYKTKSLSFICSGKSGKTSDWLKDKQVFENIVKAICQCSLKDSLQEINVYDCSLDLAVVKDMFQKHGMQNIDVNDKYEVNAR
mmetsp:Transcript_37997/g.43638  ORF Transcript_37997/g.43638 Transcript_37997/m.43638 type:complete len:182 (-) Transcript_37997:21-566(-)